ncbi:MAG: rhodanese-like domain-containing protein [Bryobacteraceae bacterium]
MKIALAVLLSVACLASAAENKSLTADEVKELVDKKQNVVYLDVREPRELSETGAIKGSVNIPLGQLESRLSELPKDKEIVTICQRGGRASRAAELLQKNGFKIAGYCGVLPWKEKNYPLVYPKEQKR